MPQGVESYADIWCPKALEERHLARSGRAGSELVAECPSSSDSGIAAHDSSDEEISKQVTGPFNRLLRLLTPNTAVGVCHGLTCPAIEACRGLT